jgi:hypothetical protein
LAEPDVKARAPHAHHRRGGAHFEGAGLAFAQQAGEHPQPAFHEAEQDALFALCQLVFTDPDAAVGLQRQTAAVPESDDRVAAGSGFQNVFFVHRPAFDHGAQPHFRRAGDQPSLDIHRTPGHTLDVLGLGAGLLFQGLVAVVGAHPHVKLGAADAGHRRGGVDGQAVGRVALGDQPADHPQAALEQPQKGVFLSSGRESVLRQGKQCLRAQGHAAAVGQFEDGKPFVAGTDDVPPKNRQIASQHAHGAVGRFGADHAGGHHYPADGLRFGFGCGGGKSAQQK